MCRSSSAHRQNADDSSSTREARKSVCCSPPPPPPPAKTLQPPDHQSGKSIAVLGRQMPVSPTLQKLQLFRRSLSSRFYITCPSRAKSLPVMCGTRSAGFADECEVKRMSQNGSTRSPSVILADNNPAYSYGYEAPKPSNAPGG